MAEPVAARDAVAAAQTTGVTCQARDLAGPRRRLGARYAILLLTVAAVIVTPVAFAALGGFRTRRSSPPIRSACRPVGLDELHRLPDVAQLLGAAPEQHPRGGLSTGIVVLFAALAAFVFARREFPGRELAYTLFTLGLLFPVTVAILPLLILVRDLGLLDNPLGLALPEAAFALPLTIIILRPFFEASPRSWRTPRPSTAAARSASSSASCCRSRGRSSSPSRSSPWSSRWNQFLLPLRDALGREHNWTLPLGVTNFSHAVHDRHRADPRLHHAGARPGARLLPLRGAPARRRPDLRIGQGMTTITPPYLEPAQPSTAGRARSPRRG